MISKEIKPKLFYEDGKWYFVDIDGSTSQPFVHATAYAGGFALVKKANYKKYRYRDMLGRITANKTQFGKDFFDFCKGQMDFSDLKLEYFADENFYKMVKSIVKSRSQKFGNYFAGVCDIKRKDAIALLAEQEIERE